MSRAKIQLPSVFSGIRAAFWLHPVALADVQ